MNLATQPEIRSLALGVRSLACAFTVVRGLFDIRVAFQVPMYRHIFEEAMPGKALPLLTLFIQRYWMLWLLVAIALPIVGAILSFALRDHFRALVAVTVVLIAIEIQNNLTTMSVLSPMVALINAISGSP